MKLQAHVIMNMALGLSLGLGATACQKTGKTSEDRAESETTPDTPVQPAWLNMQVPETPSTQQEPPNHLDELPIVKPKVKHKVMPVSKTVSHRDPCPACGMG